MIPVKRVYAPPEAVEGDLIRFPEKTAHHLKTVLRVKERDLLLVFDGSYERVTRLKFGPGGGLEGEIIEVRRPAPLLVPPLTLAFGIVRPGPVQEILRHCSELGVSRFVLLSTNRTVRNARETKERWRSVVISAASQSGRSDLPEVVGPVLLSDFLGWPMHGASKILLSNTPEAPAFPVVADSLEGGAEWTLCVGPEGGFTDAETDALLATGFVPACLGPNTLRSETACIASVAALVARAGQRPRPRTDSGNLLAKSPGE